jgi:hypothetical protein
MISIQRSRTGVAYAVIALVFVMGIASLILVMPKDASAAGASTKQGVFETYKMVVEAAESGSVLSTTVHTAGATGFVITYACISGGDYWSGSTFGRFPFTPSGPGCRAGLVIMPPNEVISCATDKDVSQGHVLSCMISGINPDTWAP